MNSNYIIIDNKKNEIIFSEKLEYLLNENNYNDVTYSITCINKYDLINELKNIIKELENN